MPGVLEGLTECNEGRDTDDVVLPWHGNMMVLKVIKENRQVLKLDDEDIPRSTEILKRYVNGISSLIQLSGKDQSRLLRDGSLP